MRTLQVDNPIDDGYEHRPELYDSEAQQFDYIGFRDRRRRMDMLSAEYAGMLFQAIWGHEIDFFQFVSIDPQTNKPYRAWTCQIPLFLDCNVLAFSGRDIGKTNIVLAYRSLYTAVNFPGGSLLYTAFDQAHVNPRVAKIINIADSTPLLSLFLDRGVGARVGRHPWFQRFINNYELLGIAAGEKSHKGMESPHVKSLIIDEAQHYSRVSWSKLLPAIDDQETNRRYGSMRLLMGVNSEGRTDTIYFELAFGEDSEFRGHVYCVPSWFNPINYTLAKHRGYLADYGNSIYSSSFKQMIRGQLGEHSRGVIPEDLYDQAVQFGRNLGLQTKIFHINKTNWETKSGNLFQMLGRRFLDKPENAGECIFSADYGSTSPTELGIWFKIDDWWTLWGRISMTRLEPGLQAHIVDQLADYFDPVLISIDSTAATHSVTSILLDPFNSLYSMPEKNYRQRVFEAKFEGQVTIRYELDKPEHAGPEYKKERLDGIDVFAVKASSNEFATGEIVRWLAEKKFAFPDDDLMRQDCLTLAEVPSSSSRAIKYKSSTGMHIVSMLRAFTLGYHVNFILEQKKLEAFQGNRDYSEPLPFFHTIDLH